MLLPSLEEDDLVGVISLRFGLCESTLSTFIFAAKATSRTPSSSAVLAENLSTSSITIRLFFSSTRLGWSCYWARVCIYGGLLVPLFFALERFDRLEALL